MLEREITVWTPGPLSIFTSSGSRVASLISLGSSHVDVQIQLNFGAKWDHRLPADGLSVQSS